jgi:50S ribosomal protein L16 3-hydroxylase
MIFDHSALTTEQFLGEYWQRKPLLLRQALPDFKPELDANDIAGLACDELSEARLITGSFPKNDWALRYGPFTEKDFRGLPETCWTLLVQDVEKHYPPLRRLLAQFSFLPSWRIDDLMVSVAGPGGSVGPHVDQYDVFLLQAEGRRRWEIAQNGGDELLPGCDLNVLKDFDPEEHWVLDPGDILYLPPGVAHHGVAQDQCMTWSIGMRSPSRADLYQTLGEWLADTADEGGRYRDPDLQPHRLPGEIDPSSIQRFKELLSTDELGPRQLESFLGGFLSRYRLAHQPAGPESPADRNSVAGALNAGQQLRHNPWTRLLWTRAEQGARLFAAGSEYRCSAEFAQLLCDPDKLSSLDRVLSGPEQDLICELLNRGHLYFEQL